MLVFRKLAFFLFIVLSSSVSFAQSSFRVSYSLPVVQSAMSTDTFLHHDITYDIWQTALSQMARSIENGMVKIYDNMGKLTTAATVKDKLSSIDTVAILNPVTLEETTRYILNVTALDADICGLSMNEKWTILNDGMIEKTILRYAPLYPNFSCHKAVYWVYPAPIVAKHQTINVEYVIDFSSFENYIDSATFTTQLMDRLLSGEANAYDPRELKPKQLNKTEIAELFKPWSGADTITTIDPVALSQTVSVEKWIGQNAIDRIRFNEEWQIDGRGNFMKQVLEYQLMTRDYEHPTGVFRGWIPFLTIRSKE